MFDFMCITKALADENRVRILLALKGKELCVCQLIELLQLAPSTVSKHLSILRQARMITSRKEGRWMYYRLNENPSYAAAADALDWVVASVKSEPLIMDDKVRLNKILSQPQETVCPQ